MHVLLYYKYTDIEDPEDLKEKQKIICERLGITGRILIAEEGINGTVGGTFEALDQYMSETMCYPGLSDIEWKISEGNDQTFPKLRVVVRPEVVTLGLKERGKDVSLKHKAHYIEPDELLRLYESGEEFTIIDARNEYEGRIGKFKDAIVPDIDNFREFPEFVASIEHLKNKPVVTYCTGGIRCEKASSYLKEQGFTDVRQLHGGIHRYADTTGGKYFDGEMYVFDGRVHVPVNQVNPTVISECHHCGTKVARYVNCCNAKCNLQFICCESCETEYGSGCSRECQKNSRFLTA
ncbi:rhodanese-related sulfurtransferase [candidate division WWE3 bacterium]|uniref:tRNA uridine(34) hydroxylase n=1 Tax=candidate division WWE3 bacterium TaxID=2053526 RepID=A0A955LI18_UNCKA|nr:rhodanese-related sulfurtransferase [candidate division WWE3 bacterium]